jgi:lysyl-tRNA synthetase class 2
MSGARKSELTASADWRPGARWPVMRLRAGLLAAIRRYFEHQGVLEVETPVLSRGAAIDPAIESFHTGYRGPGCAAGERLFLHTSPEFFMKRLLAAGSGPIYQIARVFRNAEAGRRHNPEFTLLEWYRPAFDHHRLMDDVEGLLSRVLPDHPLLQSPIERLSYRQLFIEHVGLDPFVDDAATIRDLLVRKGVTPPDAMPLSEVRRWLDLALTHLVEPALTGRALFVFDYPAEQAALARVRSDDPPVAERFELYLDGIELANGFHELTDAAQQRRRFERENRQRQVSGSDLMPVDEYFLASLEAGLPDCSGVALGIDRLVMAAAGLESIDRAVAFSYPRI